MGSTPSTATEPPPAPMEKEDHPVVLTTKPIQLWQRLVSLLVLLALSVGILVIFSDVFRTGDDMLARIGIPTTLRNYLFYIGVALYLFFYVFDISYWPGRVGALMRRLCILVVLVILLGAALVSQNSLPYVPLAVCLLSLPLSALFMSSTIFKQSDKADTARWLGLAFLIASFCTLVLWVVWFVGATDGGGVKAWAAKRVEFSTLARCNAVDEAGNYVMARRQVLSNGEYTCLSAMLLWATPVITTCVLLILGLFLFFVAKAMRGEQKLASRALKMLGGIVFLSFVGLWSSISVMGAGSGLATTAFAIYCVALISTVIVLAAIIGFGSLTAHIADHPIVAKLRLLGPETMSFIHALALFFGIFPFLAFLAVSVLNQLVRRLDHYITACQFARVLEGEEARKIRWLTAAANRQLDYLARWEWAAVLANVRFICFVMCVAGDPNPGPSRRL